MCSRYCASHGNVVWSHTAWLVGKSENRAPKEVSKARRGRKGVRTGIDDSKPLILSSEEHHLYHQYHDYSYKVNNNWSSFIAYHPSNNLEPYFVTLSIHILSYTTTWIKNIIFRQKQEKGGEMAHCLRALVVLAEDWRVSFSAPIWWLMTTSHSSSVMFFFSVCKGNAYQSFSGDN